MINNIKENPTISVITSIFNGDLRLIKISLLSIIEQSYKDFEFIIINDGSNYEISEYLKSFSKTDKRIRLVVNRFNIGLTKSLNKGLNLAKGELIARIDADDICNQKRLEIQYKFFQDNPIYSLLGSNFIFKKNNERIENNYPLIHNHDDIKEILKYKNIYCHSTIMFVKKDVFEIGLYNPIFKYAQDYDLWLRFSEKYKCTYIKDNLVECELGENSISSRFVIQQKAYSILARLKAMQRTSKKQSYFLPIILSIVKYPKAIFWLFKNKDLFK